MTSRVDELTSTLRVGLDAHMVGGQETGNETYIRGLVDGFLGLDGDFDLIAYHVGQPWRSAEGHLRFQQLAAANPLLRLVADLPLRTLQDRLGVLHTTYASPVWASCPVVVTVHDICYVAHPEWFSNRDRLVLSTAVSQSVRKAARIITVSEICRQEIIEHYRVAEERVVCIPNAAGPAAQTLSLAEATAELGRLGLEPTRPYLLAVGNLQPRKNLLRLIEAFRCLVSEGSEVDLVIAGPQHFQADQVRAAARGAGDRIRFTGYLSDRQLAASYRCAEVFVFPSLFEGFGIPALEAMAHGTAVACSGGGALAEVCGPAAVYFDPLEIESIAAALRRILADPGLRSELSELGRVREREFSWSRSAARTLDVYREVGQAS